MFICKISQITDYSLSFADVDEYHFFHPLFHFCISCTNVCRKQLKYESFKCVICWKSKCPSNASEGGDGPSEINETKFEFISKEEEECRHLKGMCLE